MVGLTKNAAAELGQFGVSVNCASPYGLVTPVAARNFAKTQGEDLERAFSAPANLKGVNLKAEDVAQAVVYLGRDDSNYVSDHNLLVDGWGVLCFQSFISQVSLFFRLMLMILLVWLIVTLSFKLLNNILSSY